MRTIISLIMALFITSCTLNHTNAIETHQVIAAPKKIAKVFNQYGSIDVTRAHVKTHENRCAERSDD